MKSKRINSLKSFKLGIDGESTIPRLNPSLLSFDLNLVVLECVRGGKYG